MNANLRNTKVKIAKVYFEKNFQADSSFKINEISTILFVRQKEFYAFKKELFEENNDSYKLNEAFFSEIEKWRELNVSNEVNIESTISEFKELYEQKIQKSYNYKDVFEQLLPLIEKLHWHYLPIYEDFMLENRDIIPEYNIPDYYDHFHSIQDLYEIISKPTDYWKTTRGDINLNLECKFAIYTNRWGHEDIYHVKRLYNGWHVLNLSIGGFSNPEGFDADGEDGGGFIANFNQDYVEYPKSFHAIILRLWELADNTEMNIEELQSKLSNVATLISQVEKTIKKYTPNWY